MHSIKFIRDNKDLVKDSLAKKKLTEDEIKNQIENRPDFIKLMEDLKNYY